MSGMRERVIEEAWDQHATRWARGEYMLGLGSRASFLDAVLAVAADVEGIAGVLGEHTTGTKGMRTVCRCGRFSVDMGQPFSVPYRRHQAEAVASYIRGRQS